MECGDVVLTPDICTENCGDFTEVASWIGRGVGVSVDATPLVFMECPAVADVSHVEHDRIGDQSQIHVGFSPPTSSGTVS